MWPSNVFSFQLLTLVLPPMLQMHLFLMCSQSMASLSMCPPTADRNSPLLGSLLRIRLHLTSCHHPSANGQVERVNTTLEQSLRFYYNYKQGNWSTSLPLAEFTPCDATGVFPFFTTRTYDPLALLLTQALGTEPRQGDQPDPHGCAADVSRL